MSRGEVTFDALIELIGAEAAERLSAERGFDGIYVPRNPGPNSPLVVVLGQGAADVLAQAYGGEKLMLPVGPGRRARIRALKAQRLTIGAIARTVGCCRRHVYEVLAEAEPAAENPPLLALMTSR